MVKETMEGNLNENKNLGVVEEYQGKKVLKVLQISIGEDQSSYKVILEDGTFADVPIVKEGKK